MTYAVLPSLGCCPESHDFLSLNLLIICKFTVRVRIFIQYGSIEFNTLTKMLGFSFNMVSLSFNTLTKILGFFYLRFCNKKSYIAALLIPQRH